MKITTNIDGTPKVTKMQAIYWFLRYELIVYIMLAVTGIGIGIGFIAAVVAVTLILNNRITC